MTVFIGDVHGKYRRYRKILKQHENTIQVGDMGVGFRDPYTEAWRANPPHKKMVEGNHRFIRGNHDNPAVCEWHSQCITDGAVEGDMMFLGGADSIDRAYRIEGYSWWPDEALSYERLRFLVDKYEVVKPRVMVTHDCPMFMGRWILHKLRALPIGAIETRTRQALETMFNLHKPEVWVFGHWHVSLDIEVDGCRFVCLNELEVKDID